MSWPTTSWQTSDLVTVSQLNALPVRIADTTLGADAASIDFTGIPGHYAHLQLKCYLRSDGGVGQVAVRIRFNGDSAANYDHQFISGFAATLLANESFGATQALIGGEPIAGSGANLFGAITIDVPHYANSANNKCAGSKYAYKVGTATTDMVVGKAAAFWRSNATITQITILPQSGNFKSGARISLYGLA